MLFTFPSRYWATIGLSGVFSLARWSWQIHAEFLVLRATQDTRRGQILADMRLSRAVAGLSRPSSFESFTHDRVLQPRARRNARGLGSSPFARHYLGNHCYFLFLRVLRCFSSPRSLRLKKSAVTCRACRVVPFGNPRIRGYLLLPAAYRSLSRPSSPPRAKASAMCPFLLSDSYTATGGPRGRPVPGFILSA